MPLKTRTKERVVDYETREVRKTFANCAACEMEYEADSLHPVSAAGAEVPYCTTCFKETFGMEPLKTLEGSDDLEERNGSISAMIALLKAVRKAHSRFISSLIDDFNGDARYNDSVDGAFKLFFYLCMVLTLAFLTIVAISGVVAIII